MESDVRYYRRRASEEFAAASRAVTEAARDRRLQLVGTYLERLKALNAPPPFDQRELDRIFRPGDLPPHCRPAFTWRLPEQEAHAS